MPHIFLQLALPCLVVSQIEAHQDHVEIIFLQLQQDLLMDHLIILPVLRTGGLIVFVGSALGLVLAPQHQHHVLGEADDFLLNFGDNPVEVLLEGHPPAAEFGGGSRPDPVGLVVYVLEPELEVGEFGGLDLAAADHHVLQVLVHGQVHDLEHVHMPHVPVDLRNCGPEDLVAVAQVHDEVHLLVVVVVVVGDELNLALLLLHQLPVLQHAAYQLQGLLLLPVCCVRLLQILLGPRQDLQVRVWGYCQELLCHYYSCLHPDLLILGVA